MAKLAGGQMCEWRIAEEGKEVYVPSVYPFSKVSEQLHMHQCLVNEVQKVECFNKMRYYALNSYSKKWHISVKYGMGGGLLESIEIFIVITFPPKLNVLTYLKEASHTCLVLPNFTDPTHFMGIGQFIGCQGGGVKT